MHGNLARIVVEPSTRSSCSERASAPRACAVLRGVAHVCCAVLRTCVARCCARVLRSMHVCRAVLPRACPAPARCCARAAPHSAARLHTHAHARARARAHAPHHTNRAASRECQSENDRFRARSRKPAPGARRGSDASETRIPPYSSSETRMPPYSSSETRIPPYGWLETRISGASSDTELGEQKKRLQLPAADAVNPHQSKLSQDTILSLHGVRIECVPRRRGLRHARRMRPAEPQAS
jgi:hypothetical protein